jgi:hypothetical protein
MKCERVPVDDVDYRILSDTEAIIEACSDSVTLFLLVIRSLSAGIATASLVESLLPLRSAILFPILPMRFPAFINFVQMHNQPLDLVYRDKDGRVLGDLRNKEE